jgi:hypothetical protein
MAKQPGATMSFKCLATKFQRRAGAGPLQLTPNVCHAGGEVVALDALARYSYTRGIRGVLLLVAVAKGSPLGAYIYNSGDGLGENEARRGGTGRERERERE